ncbi:MAG: co-chaperone GroES [Thermoguttaceae bacterium]|nr:co-chaperone GroES [Thermoguttaceae bacterium]
MKVVPLGDKIVVKRIEADEVSPGGVVLPESARETPKQGRVLSIGDGQLLPDGSRARHSVAEGDRVLFGSFVGTEVMVDGQEFLIMREEEVLAIVP